MQKILMGIGVLLILLGIFGASYTWHYDHREAETLDKYAATEFQVGRDADGNWHWADDAHIVGKDTVVVSSKSVPAPTAIRYAYRGFPMGNLYNEEGFPAAQFDVELK